MGGDETKGKVHPEVSWSLYNLGFSSCRNMMYFFGTFPFDATPDEIEDCRFSLRCPECGCDLLVYDDGDYLRDSHVCVEVEAERTCPGCGAEIVVPRADEVEGSGDISFAVNQIVDNVDGEGWSLFTEVNAWTVLRYHLVKDEKCIDALMNGWELVTSRNADEFNFDSPYF